MGKDRWLRDKREHVGAKQSQKEGPHCLQTAQARVVCVFICEVGRAKGISRFLQCSSKRDYSYREPAVDLETAQECGGGGEGILVSYWRILVSGILGDLVT